jgi:hypothetical protein
MYYCPNSQNGKRELLPKKTTITREEALWKEQNTNEWILCERYTVPNSRSRKINPIQPIAKFSKLSPPTTRRWPMDIISTYRPTIRNYYAPLAAFAHYHEAETTMVKDKTKAAVAMRQPMMTPRATDKIQTAATRAPTTGRGGRRSGGSMGRGGGTTNPRQERASYKALLLQITTVNEIMSDEKETVNMSDIAATIPTNEGTQTISDLTKPTNDEAEPMETEENILAPITMTSVPTEIVKFTPNIQWTRDLQRDLPKTRYRL